MIEEPAKLRIKREMRRPSAAQVAGFQEVPTGFVVDAMMGKGALSAGIGPVGEGRDIACVAAGPALTAGCGPADILATLAALKFVQPGDILVAAFDGYKGCAAVGDRVSGMAKNCGAAGFVTDGPVRDYTGIVEVGLPIWCTGLTPASPLTSGPGTVGLAVQIGGQQVETGDMIVADRDGVVVVPFAEIDAVLARLPEIDAMEAELDGEVAAGLKVPQTILDLIASDATVEVE